jgi:hypothetical protein
MPGPGSYQSLNGESAKLYTNEKPAPFGAKSDRFGEGLFRINKDVPPVGIYSPITGQGAPISPRPLLSKDL